MKQYPASRITSSYTFGGQAHSPARSTRAVVFHMPSSSSTSSSSHGSFECGFIANPIFPPKPVSHTDENFLHIFYSCSIQPVYRRVCRFDHEQDKPRPRRDNGYEYDKRISPSKNKKEAERSAKQKSEGKYI